MFGKDQELLEESDRLLQELLSTASPDDLQLLSEYNFGKEVSGKTAEEILQKIRESGSNTVARSLSGKRVHYLQIVRDVADKMDVPWGRSEDEEAIERHILVRLFHKAWESMGEAERETVKHLFEQNGAESEYVTKLLVEGTFRDFLPAISYLVFWNISRLVALSMAQASGTLAAQGILGGLVAETLFGPLGIVVGTVFVAIELVGPAYRKTIPSVLQIAYMRQKCKGLQNGVLGCGIRA